jgi:hypothetical protein
MTQSWILQDHILRDSRVCGMDSDFDSVLDGLHETIPSFDLSSFTRKDCTPSSLKSNMFWCMFYLIKLFKAWKLSLM